MHPGVLQTPLVIAAGSWPCLGASRQRGYGGEEGRFPILRRMSPTAVVPQSEGVEGWLWTMTAGSALPMLGEGPPNLALVFVKPLEESVVMDAFQPAFLAALAQRSRSGCRLCSGCWRGSPTIGRRSRVSPNSAPRAG
jgi:hypothetical protein